MLVFTHACAAFASVAYLLCITYPSYLHCMHGGGGGGGGSGVEDLAPSSFLSGFFGHEWLTAHAPLHLHSVPKV